MRMIVWLVKSSQVKLPLITRSSAIAVIADRTACSILTLFIVSTTSRPLNKKSVCCQSANPINNYCRSASANPQSAHLSACAVGTGLGGRTEWHRVIVDEPIRSAINAITVYWDSGFQRVAVRFLWCILWLNDTSYSKSVKRDKQEHVCQVHAGTTLAAYTNPESHNAQRYRQTDGQTDRQQAAANSRSRAVAKGGRQRGAVPPSLNLLCPPLILTV